MGNSPQTTRFAIFNLERISFSVYIIPESNLVPEREFHSDWKPENDLKRNKILFWYHVSTWWEMQRWNQLVPEWKSFRYHVNSPLSRGTCMFHAYTYVAFLWHPDGRNLPHFCVITSGCTQVHLNQTYNHTKLTLFFTGFWGMSWISKYWRCKDCLWWYVSP